MFSLNYVKTSINLSNQVKIRYINHNVERVDSTGQKTRENVIQVLHNRHHKVSQSVPFFMHCKIVTILLRIRVRGHFVMSITKNHESYYVTVLDNPLERRGNSTSYATKCLQINFPKGLQRATYVKCTELDACRF